MTIQFLEGTTAISKIVFFFSVDFDPNTELFEKPNPLSRTNWGKPDPRYFDIR